jgi:hypothetical protein
MPRIALLPSRRSATDRSSTSRAGSKDAGRQRGRGSLQGNPPGAAFVSKSGCCVTDAREPAVEAGFSHPASTTSSQHQDRAMLLVRTTGDRGAGLMWKTYRCRGRKKATPGDAASPQGLVSGTTGAAYGGSPGAAKLRHWAGSAKIGSAAPAKPVHRALHLSVPRLVSGLARVLVLLHRGLALLGFDFLLSRSLGLGRRRRRSRPWRRRGSGHESGQGQCGGKGA